MIEGECLALKKPSLWPFEGGVSGNSPGVCGRLVVLELLLESQLY